MRLQARKAVAPVVDDGSLVTESSAKFLQLILLLKGSTREKRDDQDQGEEGSHGEPRARGPGREEDYKLSTT
jgi:hypothetical protein